MAFHLLWVIPTIQPGWIMDATPAKELLEDPTLAEIVRRLVQA